MRPIEILLSFANLLTFFALVVPCLGAGSWKRHSAPIALLVAVAQATMNGPRWQMVPAYTLAGLIFPFW